MFYYFDGMKTGDREKKTGVLARMIMIWVVNINIRPQPVSSDTVSMVRGLQIRQPAMMQCRYKQHEVRPRRGAAT